MRLLWVRQDAMPPTQAGPTRCFSLARALVRLGHEVSIVASSFDRLTRRHLGDASGARIVEETIEGVRFLWVRTPAYQANDASRVRNLLAYAWTVARLARRPILGPLDLVIGSSPYPFAAFAASRIARARDVPFVFEVRDLWPRTLIEVGRVSARHPACLALDRLERLLYRRAAAVISPLQGIEQHVRSRGASAPVAWVPNGADLSQFPPPDPPPEGPLTILYAGRLNRGNDLDTLIEAIREVRTTHPASTLRFRFLGDGPEAPRVRRATELLGLGVEFSPPVPSARLAYELQRAHVLWAAVRDLPLYRSGISLNKFFDYMAAGRPVVFAGPSAHNPLAAAGCGSISAPQQPAALADAVRQIAAMSPAERWRMGLRGRRYVERHHDFAEIAAQLESHLRAACGRPPVASDKGEPPAEPRAARGAR